MRQTSGQSAVWAVAAIAIIALLVVAFIYSSPKPQASGIQLSSAVILGAKANEFVQIPITVMNHGGPANQLSVTLVSDAFSGPIGVNPVNVGAGTSTTIYANAVVQDVPPGNHQISITYTYNDSNGTHTGSVTTQIQVVPNVVINNVQYSQTSFLGIPYGTKNSIGVNDHTNLFFKIQSESSLQVYSGLVASIQFNGSSGGLTIQPQSIQLGSIGPQGLSSQYNFTIYSNNSPPGTYHFAIVVSWEGSQVAAYADSIKVTS